MYNSEVDFTNLLAFCPAYGEHGCITQLIYPGGGMRLDISINSLIKRACRSYALDKKALANAAKFVSGHAHLVPLPLALGRTFAPIKCHNPRVKGDPAYGYFLLQGITKVDKTDAGSKIVLTNDVELTVVQSQSVVLNHLARALLFERMFWSKRLGKDYI